MQFYRATFFYSILFLFFSHFSFGQVGTSSFSFLDLPISGQQVALGSINISSTNTGVNSFMSNPALLTDSLSDYASFSYYNYYAGTKATAFSFVKSFKPKQTFAINLWQLNYGTFDGYDPTGTFQGTFKAKDFALTLGYSHNLGVFTIGGNLKFVQSSIESYSSSGLLFDIGGTFTHPEKDLQIGLVIKNAGFQLSKFSPSDTGEMPFDVQLGVSFKPKKMPLRFSITAHHLQEFDIAYKNSNEKGQTNIFGDDISKDISFADKLSRHFVIGGEFVFSKNFNFRFGYNFLQRKELALEERKGGVGFSYGLMMKIKKIEFSFSHATLHASGGTNAITISLDTKRFTKKKRIIE